jgi:raffinose/stachyose/melibiose transport system permease protein
LGFSTNLTLSNYARGLKTPGFVSSFINSLVTTIPTVLIVILICAQGAYALSRAKNKIIQLFYYMFIASLLIPFQTIMLPLYVNLKGLHLFNSLVGFVLVRVGFQIAYNILLFTGFIKTVPVELEEAAYLDGLDVKKTFWLIVFPLLKPVLVTSIIINTVYTWNDFQTALIILQKTALRTLPLLQYAFFGEHYTDLGLAFSVFNMSAIPIIIIYLLLQKQIMGGLTAGAVKS